MKKKIIVLNYTNKSIFLKSILQYNIENYTEFMEYSIYHCRYVFKNTQNLKNTLD